jgi:serine/threonine protein kinase
MRSPSECARVRASLRRREFLDRGDHSCAIAVKSLLQMRRTIDLPGSTNPQTPARAPGDSAAKPAFVLAPAGGATAAALPTRSMPSAAPAGGAAGRPSGPVVAPVFKIPASIVNPTVPVDKSIAAPVAAPVPPPALVLTPEAPSAEPSYIDLGEVSLAQVVEVEVEDEDDDDEPTHVLAMTPALAAAMSVAVEQTPTPRVASPRDQPTPPAAQMPALEAKAPANDQEDALLGLVIDDRYRLERVIGTGGMSRVYLGLHIRSVGKVAVKIVELQLSHKPEMMTRCVQEARVMMEIQSNHIVRAYDVGTFPTGQLYVVMEFLEGETLDDLLQREGPLPWARLGPIALQICNGLNAGHKRGIYHRDIKPQNCMRVDLDDNVDHIKLIDFGLSKDVNGAADVTQEGIILGTPEYMAPELVGSRTNPDARSDVYALGATLYKLLTGRPVFQGNSTLDMLFNHKYAPPVPPSQVAPGCGIPVAADEIILRALAKDPAMRFASAEEMGAALRVALGQPRTIARDPPSNPEMPLVGSERPATPPRAVASAARIVEHTDPLLEDPTSVDARPFRSPFPWARVAAVVLVLGLLGALVVSLMAPPAADEPKQVAANEGAAEPPSAPAEPAKALVAASESTGGPDDDAAADDPEPTSTKKRPEPNFDYRSARKYIEEQHGFLRQTCMKKGPKPLTQLRFRVEVRANGRASVVVPGDKAVRACVQSVLGFMFDPSPRGGAFQYTLTSTSAKLDRKPL